MHACMLSRFSCILLFVTLWSVARQAPLSMGFSRQEHWTGLPCPFPLRMEVQFSSVAQSCPILCDSMNRSPPGLPVHHQLLEFTQTHVHESVMPSSHLILCCPLLLLPPIPPSIRVFSNELTLHMRWPKSCGVSALASFLPKNTQD